MSGIKPKKFPLNLTKETFMSRMIFHTDEEKRKCQSYLDLKGVQYHIVLANFIGLNRFGKVEYKKVSFLYQYDKRIRNILYKYLSAFEENLRAFICNKYSLQIENFQTFNLLIVDKIGEGSSLSRELESLEMREIISLVLKLPKEDKEEMFGSIEHLEQNLAAVKELRNAVSHHRLLFVYEDFEPCFINGVERDSLLDNIVNLMNLINPYYKNFLREEINNAILDKEEKTFSSSIPSAAVLFIPKTSSV